MGQMSGRVAVISGAARGQGRMHALRLAEEGASIVGFDACCSFRHVMTPSATLSDLSETERLVRGAGQRALTAKVDARNLQSLTELADRAMAEFDKIDTLIINHGIWSIAPNSWELEEESWQESIDVNLTGAWKVIKAFVPAMLKGAGGAIVFTSSTNGLRAQPGAIAYCAAKAGIINMMHVLAWELGPHNIRVNAICPGAVDTLAATGGTWDIANRNWPRFWQENRALLPGHSALLPPDSVADAVLWLVSDQARYVTGVTLPIDAGRSAF
jgi:(+)-trans-carveol dehydrogenase